MPKKKDTTPPVEQTGGVYFENDRGVETFSSGCQLLDLALGGGWAEGRVINIVGDKSTGKTLLAIEATANFALKYPKGIIKYVEVEQAFDPGYAASLGMPVDRIEFPQDIFTVEDLFKSLDETIEKAKQPTLLIVDSLDALSDEAEMKREFNEGSYGAQKAKQMSAMFRQLNQKMSKSNVTLIIISQVRDKIGIAFGDKTSRSGGRALDFYASQVAYLAHIGQEKQTHKGIERVTGVRIKANIKKNKIALPFRQVEFSIQFGYGVQSVEASLEWLEDTKNFGELSKLNRKDYMKALSDMPDDALKAELQRIQEVTAGVWNSVELALAPTVKKYG